MQNQHQQQGLAKAILKEFSEGKKKRTEKGEGGGEKKMSWNFILGPQYFGDSPRVQKKVMDISSRQWVGRLVVQVT